MGFKEKARDKAKELLSSLPTAYRIASLTYRSGAVARGIAHVAKRATPIMMGARPIVVSYPSTPRPRWTSAPHPRLSSIIGAARPEFERRIRDFSEVRSGYERIPISTFMGDLEPSFVNGYFGGIDAVALYGMLATTRPRRYIEVGSGNSTKFARRAIRDHGLPTKITSIDPEPRADIDTLCDEVIRQPLEDVDVALFDALEGGDILFFDGSHHTFMNSDGVTLWLDILPRLKAGVLVQIHDIFLPFDYPDDWVERYYTEQYLLAVSLMSPTPTFDTLFASQFIVRDPELARLADERIGPRAQGEAASFWLGTRAPSGGTP